VQRLARCREQFNLATQADAVPPGRVREDATRVIDAFEGKALDLLADFHHAAVHARGRALVASEEGGEIQPSDRRQRVRRSGPSLEVRRLDVDGNCCARQPLRSACECIDRRNTRTRRVDPVQSVSDCLNRARIGRGIRLRDQGRGYVGRRGGRRCRTSRVQDRTVENQPYGCDSKDAEKCLALAIEFHERSVPNEGARCNQSVCVCATERRVVRVAAAVQVGANVPIMQVARTRPFRTGTRRAAGQSRRCP
jgi:hypothetical protein